MTRLMAGIGKGRFPVYVGDDISDEAAFRAIKESGIAVSVGSSLEADYYLRNQGEVREFLELLTGISDLREIPDEN